MQGLRTEREKKVVIAGEKCAHASAMGFIHSTGIECVILRAATVYRPPHTALPAHLYQTQVGKGCHSALEDTMATRDVVVLLHERASQIGNLD